MPAEGRGLAGCHGQEQDDRHAALGELADRFVDQSSDAAPGRRVDLVAYEAQRGLRHADHLGGGVR